MSESAIEGIKLTIPLGGVSYSYDLAFLMSVALAVLVVFLFSMSKFGESTIQKSDDDFISQFLPKYLATPEEYSRALIFYITTMAGIVVLLSFLGPRVVNLGATDVPTAPSAWPLFVALVLVGFLPNVPWLQEVELRLRRLAHERAFIPKAARATAERLAAAEFNYSSYLPPQVLNSPAMRGVRASDFSAPRDSIEYAWARLSCLLYRVKYMQDSGLVTSLDGDVLERYGRDLESFALHRRSMEDEIAKYRDEKANNPFYTDDDLHGTIAKTLRKLYTLLGCAVRLKLYNDTEMEMNPALQPFGFVLGSTPAGRGHNNLIIVGLAVMGASIFVIVSTGIAICSLLSSLHLWQASDYFPRQIFDAFVWSFSAIAAHGCSIFVAERMRSGRLSKSRWFMRRGPVRRRAAANYILVAIVCAVAGFAVLFAFSSLFVSPSLVLAKAVISYALLPAASGMFYVVHLDNVELKRRPPRWAEIAIQSAITGFCGFVAASAGLEITGDNAATGADLVVLIAVFGIAIGASLAWYLPEAAALSEQDPLSDAMETRVSALKTAALQSFGSAELADGWLDKPNPVLNQQSPRAASAELPLFEKALALLESRRLAA